MKKPSILRSLLSVSALSLFVIYSPAIAQEKPAAASGWSFKGTGPIELHLDGKLFTTYQTKDVVKPYFYPLIGPTGENVTRHWPMKEGVEGEAHDHPHHHSMWFGLGSVEGIDFWHEPASGKKPKPFGSIIHTETGDLSVKDNTASFTTKAEWQGPDQKKIMEDHRVFKFTRGDDGRLIIDSTISLIASEGDVTINDDKEGAWALRVMPTLRLKGPVAKGTMINSNGKTDKDVWGKRASWVDYSGPTPKGKTIGIAIMDHPKNLRYPTWYHARDYGLFTANPFGQGHFEKGAEKGAGDYIIPKGKTLTLSYRTILHHGDAEAAGIDAAFKEWAGEASK